MTAIYDEAKKLVKLGFNPFAIQENSKKPVKAWKNLQDNKVTGLDLQASFAGFDGNAAIATGPVSGVVVVDIDVPELYDEFIEKYPTDRVVQTPSGGYHLYYRYNSSDIGNSASRLASGIDVRGHGGYVLVPPSHIDGRYYTWLKEGEPAPLARELHDHIKAEMVVEGETVVTLKDDAKDLWEKILRDGFTPHRHNEEVKDAARYLYRMGLNEATILQTIRVENDKDATPLSVEELQATIQSGLNYEKARKKNDTSLVAPPSRAYTISTDFHDWLYSFDQTKEAWLIEEWLPSESVMFLVAAPENYKTWLAMEIAIQVAHADAVLPFMGKFAGPAKPVPVLIIQQEDQMRQLAKRLEVIEWAKFKDKEFYEIAKDGTRHTEPNGELAKLYHLPIPTDAPIYVKLDGSFALDDAEENDGSFIALEQDIKDKQIGLVIIDPFYMLADASDFYAAAARKMAKIKRLRDLYGTTFLFVHHNRKSGGNGREQIFGSQLLQGSFEGGFIIEKNAAGVRSIQRYGKRFPGQQNKWIIEFYIDTEEYIYEVKLDLPAERTKEEIVALKKVLERKNVRPIWQYVQKHPECSRAALVHDLKLSHVQVGRALSQLKEVNLVAEVGGFYSASDVEDEF